MKGLLGGGDGEYGCRIGWENCCWRGAETRRSGCQGTDGCRSVCVDGEAGLRTKRTAGPHVDRLSEHPLTRRNKQDLLTLLNELKTELASLRVQKIAGGSASKLTKMCVDVPSFWDRDGVIGGAGAEDVGCLPGPGGTMSLQDGSTACMPQGLLDGRDGLDSRRCV